jgi:hypothetical protein
MFAELHSLSLSPENPRLIEDENYLNRFQSLYERSYDLIQRWNVELRFDNLLWEGRYLLLKIANDPTTQRIIEDLKALGKDLFLGLSLFRFSFSILSHTFFLVFFPLR